MMSLRGFSRALDSGFASSDLSDLFVSGAGFVKGRTKPKIWHLLEIVRLGEIAFRGRYHRLEGSLKLKRGAFLSPATRALSVGKGRLLGLYEGHLGRPRGWAG